MQQLVYLVGLVLRFPFSLLIKYNIIILKIKIYKGKKAYNMC